MSADTARAFPATSHPYEFFCGRCLVTLWTRTMEACEKLMHLPCPHQYDGEV